MKRKQRKTVLTVLRDWAIENAITDKAVLRERFDKCIEEPDPVKAVEREKNDKFNRWLASIKDRNGQRIAFPVKSADGNTKIHIVPGSTDIEAVSVIEDRLRNNSQGNTRTRRPVTNWKAELLGQTNLDFDKAENE